MFYVNGIRISQKTLILHQLPISSFTVRKLKANLKKSEDLPFIDPPPENVCTEFLNKLCAENNRIVELPMFADFQNLFIPAEKHHKSPKLPNSIKILIGMV